VRPDNLNSGPGGSLAALDNTLTRKITPFMVQPMTQDVRNQAADSCRLEALLKVSRIIVGQQEFGALLNALSVLLHEVVEYDFLVLLLYDADVGEAWVYYPGSCEERVTKTDRYPFVDGPSYLVWKNQKIAVKSIEDFDSDYPRIAPKRRSQNVQSSCTVPLTTVHRQLGALEFASSKPEAYSDPEDVRFIQLVAAQVATAVDNALVYDRVRASEKSLAHERDHLQTLLEVTNAAASKLDTAELIQEISKQVERVLGAEFCGLVVHDLAENTLRWEVIHFSRRLCPVRTGRVASMSGPVVAQAFLQKTARMVCRQEMEALSESNELMRLLRGSGIRSFCALPLVVRETVIGVLTVGHLQRNAFSKDDIRLMGEIARQVSMSVGNTLAYREIKTLRDKLNSEKLYLEEEIKAQYNFEEIIGRSKKLQSVLQQVELVAESDSSVLILGETGTGKELIARAIHNLSQRNKHTLVKVNCAAIPSSLLESDLFGHEKGAFTGAINKKIGRFELAHQGTIFLDEVGDIPMELQSKLLRVLQEHEFERLGNARPIHVDTRIIAATNRNLPQMISERLFRSDLYYRLNVFPLYVPPLRERTEDIPVLVCYFAEKYARKLKRDIQTIPPETMNMLMQMPWPGNIRELEHLIERAVIVSRGSVLQVPLEPLSNFFPVSINDSPLVSLPGSGLSPPVNPEMKTLDDMERTHILSVLQDANGVVGGAHGAASRLGLKRTTLLSKMKRLGIVREGVSPSFYARP
jgi:formate hydrogenlyase transcriptional activator